ncbi:MAG: site-specific integrase [Deltaproteobacteria bacterium]
MEADRWRALRRAEVILARTPGPVDPARVPTLAVLAEPWLARRKITHRAWREDGNRWRKHLQPAFGHLRPSELDVGQLRAFVEAKRSEGLTSTTCRAYLAILSGLFEDLKERGFASTNPARALPKTLSRLVRPSHDPRTTPFLEKLDDVRRVYLALPSPANTAFALGALAGLRPGEAFALRWIHVDLAARRVHVREQMKGPLKDTDSRIVPILDPLLPVLKAAHVQAGGKGLVVPAGPRARFAPVDDARQDLRAALVELGLSREGLGWYEATRHTFASHWVLGGRPLEHLREILGHSTIALTERYAHLRPDLFAEAAYSALSVNLVGPPAEVRQIPGRSTVQVAEKTG